jgi:quercetin dioxygenase-like cupin family protein
MDLDTLLPPPIRALPMTDGRLPTHKLSAPGCDVLFLTAPAGAALPAHHHDTENATVILSGATVITTEDGEHRYGPGEWYQTSPGQTHAVRFEGDTVQIELRFAREAP